MKYLACITIWLMPYLLMSQVKEDKLMGAAMAKFKPKSDRYWWLKDMRGFLDHTHEIRMVLATDNSLFTGAYEVISSGQIFYLDGGHDGEQIVLVEYDSLERITGYIKGDMNEDKFYCTWSDKKNIEQLPLYLYTATTNQTPCGNAGWAHHWVKSKTEKDSLISVTAIKEEDDIRLQLRYPRSWQEIDMEATSKSAIFTNKPTDFDDDLDVEINIDKNTLRIGKKKVKKTILLDKLKSLFLNCTTYHDYDDKVSFVYPLLGEKKFDDYIEKEILTKHTPNSAYTKLSSHDLSANDRMIHVAYGQCHIDYFSDTLISGVVLYQSTSMTDVQELPFSYHFKKQRPVDFTTLFLPTFAYKDFINATIDQLKSGLDKNDDRYDYFFKSDFDIITFCPQGLKCKSKFSTLYGEYAFIIPYKDLQIYTKKKNLLK